MAIADEVRLGRLVEADKKLKEEELKRDYKIKMAECYEKIIELAKRYLDMPEEHYHVIASWIIGTYSHEQFPAYPYLFFNAMRGGGKTRTLKFISALGNKGDGSVQNNLTEAVIFRIPRNTTTCIDEVEQIGSKEKQTLRELLNSAYKKGMKVKRMRKVKLHEGSEQQVVETFEPYYPIAMANIWGMDEVLGDRSITLILEKSNCPLRTKMYEDFDSEEFQSIKRTLEQFSVVSECSYAKTIYRDWNNYISNKYTTTYITLIPETTQTTQEKLKLIDLDNMFNKIDDLGITGRNLELLMPLLLINQSISDEHFDRFLVIGKKIMEIKKEDEYADSKDVMLYDFVGKWMHESKEYKSIKSLVQEFRLFCGEGDQDDKWLNERWLGRALKRLNLIVDRRRLSSGFEVTLDHAKAKNKLEIFRKENKQDG